MPIPAVVTELTGISDADVKDAPAFGHIAHKVLAFLEGADFGGFNVERFDLPLLAREFTDAGIKFDYANRTVYDAQKIYHLHERRDLSAAFAFYCHQELKDAHSATADAQATLSILQEQLKRYAPSVETIEGLKEFALPIIRTLATLRDHADWDFSLIDPMVADFMAAQAATTVRAEWAPGASTSRPEGCGGRTPVLCRS